jgi:hypothetical protein
MRVMSTRAPLYASPKKQGVLDRTWWRDFSVVAPQQLSFGPEPVFDVMPVFTAVRLKQVIRALADGLCRDAGHDIRLRGALGGTRRYWLFLYHINPPRSRLVRSRRAADEHAPQALFKKACVDKVPKQDPAQLPVETCHLSGVSGGELYAGCLHEQMLDACERFVETPRLEWLRHVRCSSQFLAIWASGERDHSPCKTMVDVRGDCVRPSPTPGRPGL